MVFGVCVWGLWVGMGQPENSFSAAVCRILVSDKTVNAVQMSDSRIRPTELIIQACWVLTQPTLAQKRPENVKSRLNIGSDGLVGWVENPTWFTFQ